MNKGPVNNRNNKNNKGRNNNNGYNRDARRERAPRTVEVDENVISGRNAVKELLESGRDVEKIYIGHQNIMKDSTYEMLVYDWRAPIASMYYRNEIGEASYEAPCGEIRGQMSLKRQYEISKGELEYFFDSSVAITDDLLQQALGNNASSYMKNIVETIQKEQDLIIRDKGNDLLHSL